LVIFVTTFLDSKVPVLCVMLRRALEIIPHRSSREPPFHSCLQSCHSEITSWRHLILAHLPVHPPTLHALLTQRDSKITRETEKRQSSIPPFLPNSVTVGEGLFPPTSSHQPPT
ncbi:hypothetical protein CHARACLAT_013519, partial [Characodon lateralis]|nr:hypothetical protein [Characodon lateralis]